MIIKGWNALATALLFSLPVANAAAEESVKVFSGEKTLTNGEDRSTQYCPQRQALTLYLRGGTISDGKACGGPVQANGAFSGQCNLPNTVLSYSGQIAGNALSLKQHYVWQGATCDYSANLQEMAAPSGMTVQQLLVAGAKKLTRDEIVALYVGSTISGIQLSRPEFTFQIRNAIDGTVTGNAWRNGVWTTAVNGRWTANERGEICLDLTNSQGQKITGCNPYFLLSGRYYASSNDQPSTIAYERQISR